MARAKTSPVEIPRPTKHVFCGGRHLACCDPECTSKAVPVLDIEQWDSRDRVIVGEQHCPACGCKMLFARKATAEDVPRLTHMHAVVYWREGFLGRSRAAGVIVETPPLDPLEATRDEWNHPIEWPSA